MVRWVSFAPLLDTFTTYTSHPVPIASKCSLRIFPEASAIALWSQRANTEGPEPDMFIASAPVASIFSLSSSKPGMNCFLYGSATKSCMEWPMSLMLPVQRPATRPPTFPHWRTASCIGTAFGRISLASFVLTTICG